MFSERIWVSVERTWDVSRETKKRECVYLWFADHVARRQPSGVGFIAERSHKTGLGDMNRTARRKKRMWRCFSAESTGCRSFASNQKFRYYLRHQRFFVTMPLRDLPHTQGKRSSALVLDPWPAFENSGANMSLTPGSPARRFGHPSRVISPDPSRHYLIQRFSPRVSMLTHHL